MSAVQAGIPGLRLPAIFGDHMVLQSGLPLNVWGWDRPGVAVSVRIDGNEASGKADAEGRWSVVLPPLAPGGPHQMQIQGSQAATLEDVLVGEVWLASGQSNMAINVEDRFGAGEAVREPALAQIRQFEVRQSLALEPLEDLQGRWVVADAETLKSFSAVAFFAALSIARGLKVPVGIIKSAWSGSVIESWLPASEQMLDPDLRAKTQEWQGLPAERRRQAIERTPFDLELKDLAWAEAGRRFSLRAWKSNQPEPQAEHGDGWARIRGVSEPGIWIWGETDAEPEALAEKATLTFLARGQGLFRVYLSGKEDLDSDWPASPYIELSPEWTPYRFHTGDFSQAGWGAERAAHAGKGDKLMFRVERRDAPLQPGGMYNAMIAPIAGFTMRGVFWYQGEGNSRPGSHYDKFLPALVKRWRDDWGSELCFLSVQLPNYKSRALEPTDDDWTRFRELQRSVLSLPHTALVIAYDLGEADDVHPRDKRSLGERLGTTALGLAYGSAKPWAGPVLRRVEMAPGKLIAHFDPRGSRLVDRGGGPLKGFAVAGADGVFHWADAALDGDKVVLTCSQVPEPRWIRYAWADNPDATLFNAAGFPAEPFRTDAFPQRASGHAEEAPT